MITKVISRADAQQRVQQAKANGTTVVFTSGAFDLLHQGHVAYLKAARALGGMLVVGVNSDRSIQQYKDPLRPIVPQDARAAVLAGLGCVDLVFIFDELNNNTNIELLKPSIYAKAGDYSKEKLSSANLVESYGGRVELLKFEEGFSTSSIIDRVLARYGGKIIVGHELPLPAKQPAVFVDRDGTIIEHVEYLHEPEKVKLLPGAAEGLKAFADAGYRIVITTNQPGIGLGYFTKEDFFAVTRAMFQQLSKAGVAIDKVYYSPHSQAANAPDRKPAIGMIERAVRELNVDLSKSVVIGDMTVDIQFGNNAGVPAVMVKTGRCGDDGLYPNATAAFVAADILEASRLTLKPRKQ